MRLLEEFETASEWRRWEILRGLTPDERHRLVLQLPEPERAYWRKSASLLEYDIETYPKESGPDDTILGVKLVRKG